MNDEQVRLADDLTYQELADALTTFLTASHELGGFTNQELPTLPSEEKYMEAVEHNELFNRLPQRLVVRDAPTTDQPEQTVKSSQPQSEASSQAANDAEPASAASQAATDVADAASVATQPVMPAVAIADSTLTIVIDQIVAVQKEANDIMTKAYRQLSSDLEVRRQDFIKEHEHALGIREDSDKAQAEKERLQFANAEVLNIEERRDQLKSVKMDLEGQIGQLQAESSKWQFRVETVQEDLELVKQQLVEVNQQYEHRLQSDQVDLAQHQELAQQACQAKLAKWFHPFKNRQKETKHVSQP
ncbi:hypothetical protein FKV73_02695 [Weissella paramesenteroides]|nr:hypothetical protein FKV79_04775 [Weissella paramesenteroides]KAA8438595.1 hypothetical protein FKV73_02695 [Weissella paramesenteroides]